MDCRFFRDMKKQGGMGGALFFFTLRFCKWYTQVGTARNHKKVRACLCKDLKQTPVTAPTSLSCPAMASSTSYLPPVPRPRARHIQLSESLRGARTKVTPHPNLPANTHTHTYPNPHPKTTILYAHHVSQNPIRDMHGESGYLESQYSVMHLETQWEALLNIFQ